MTVKTNPSATLRAFWLGLLLLCCSFPLRAEQFGLFTYVMDDTVMITDYPTDATGPVEIPAEIAGRPVTSIGSYAFFGCTGLTSVTIPSSVTGIGYHAFFGCSGLTSVAIPSSVASIGDNAFRGCTGLTSVTLPQGLTTLSLGIFEDCTGLTSITIPSSVTSIGQSAFLGCTGLTGLNVPSSVTSIGNFAFYGCAGLSSVTIPSSVSSIDYFAFSECTGLTSVAIPFASIGSYAFSGCTGLTSVTFPRGLETLSFGMFKGCTGLTSFTIPTHVTRILGGTFSGCTGLTSINVEAGNTAYASDAGVLLNAARTVLILCPEGKAGAYSIPSSVTSIGGFYDCTALTSVTIPSSVTSIGPEAFSGCIGLTSITIPSSVISIGGYAFWGCTGLTSVTVPSSVTSIGDAAFEGCTGLTSVNVEAGNPAYASDGGVLLNAARTLLIRCPHGKAGSYSIPSSVTSMEPGAFFGCTGLTSINIPSSVATIRYNTFSGCTGLTSVTIPSSVTWIGHCVEDEGSVLCLPAFTGCTAMKRMVFLGDAPLTVSGEFAQAAPGFTIYYLSSRSGFTSPTWLGYPATMINETTYPAAGWLLEHGLWYDTDLHTDSDGDGVDLLMAYALDLDPRQNLQASLPVPVLSETTLSLDFHATAPGLTYRAETSTGLTNWTTAGVTQSAPGPDGRSTATVPLDAPRRFLRLTVED